MKDGDTLKHGLGFNNHLHFFHELMPENTHEIGNVKKFIVKLLDLTLTVTNPFKDKYEAVLQLGKESWPLLNDPELLHFLKKECELRGITPITHQTDEAHPLAQGFGDQVCRCLSVSQKVGSPCLIIHLPPHSMNVLKETAQALTLNEILDSLHQTEVNIALENAAYEEPAPFFGQTRSVTKLLETIVYRLKRFHREDLEKRYRICFDYGHFTVNAHRLGLDVEEVKSLFSTANKKIQALHVHINDGTGDQHLLLGEHPQNANLERLKNFERIYLGELKKLKGEKRIFIIEKGSSFQAQDMIRCFQILDAALSA